MIFKRRALRHHRLTTRKAEPGRGRGKTGECHLTPDLFNGMLFLQQPQGISQKLCDGKRTSLLRGSTDDIQTKCFKTPQAISPINSCFDRTSKRGLRRHSETRTPKHKQHTQHITASKNLLKPEFLFFYPVMVKVPLVRNS